jgi:hypothetical protein
LAQAVVQPAATGRMGQQRLVAAHAPAGAAAEQAAAQARSSAPGPWIW